MAKSDNIEEMLRQDEEEFKSELMDIIRRIDAGEKTLHNYYSALQWYRILDRTNQYKPVIQNFMNLTTEAAWRDIEINSNAAEAYKILSEICQYQKDKEKMFTYINKAIELEPDNADFYFCRGKYYEELKKKNLAEQDFNKACELNPKIKESVKLHKDVSKTINEGRFLKWVLYLLIVIAIVFEILDFFR